ncbi:MAG: hypothetical protein CW694_02875 [Candidatus Syntrophoarchaeum sp. WYZ-LMO15]|nr:MAG: hypothetical protein CW694_02875 [Candidatus Syntrophoarchaeum sp. WYZ-LMO15]
MHFAVTRDFERSIAEYILKHYTGRVVEVGIGWNTTVARYLHEAGCLITTTDIIDEAIPGAPNYIKDDIFHPDPEIYRNARLIYSIRPPEELQIAIAKVASSVGADLILKPLGSEIADLSAYFKVVEVINYGSAHFNLYRGEKRIISE